MIYYIMGYGRSGTTLVENILSKRLNAQSCGEIKYVAERAMVANERCSCGKKASECVFWEFKLRELKRKYDPSKVAKLTDKFESSKYFFINLMLLLLKRNRYGLEYYQSFNKELLELLSDDVPFFDGSKMPARLFFNYRNMSRINNSVKVFWVVRDPRAVAWSCSRIVKRTEATKSANSLMPIFGFWASIIKWFCNSVVCTAVVLFTGVEVEIIRYEDFVLANADIEYNASEDTGRVPHSVSGNPSRMKKTSSKITIDAEWETKLGSIKKYLAWVLCLPFMLCFRYAP